MQLWWAHYTFKRPICLSPHELHDMGCHFWPIQLICTSWCPIPSTVLYNKAAAAGHLSWSLLISSPSFLHARWVAGWDCAGSDARRHEGWRGSHDEDWGARARFPFSAAARGNEFLQVILATRPWFRAPACAPDLRALLSLHSHPCIPSCLRLSARTPHSRPPTLAKRLIQRPGPKCRAEAWIHA